MNEPIVQQPSATAPALPAFSFVVTTNVMPPVPLPSVTEDQEPEQPQPLTPVTAAATEGEPSKKRVRQQHTILVKKCKNEVVDLTVEPSTKTKTRTTTSTKKEKKENPIPSIGNIEETQPLNYSVAELKDNLKTHGLQITGTKQILHDRLFKYLRAVRAVIRLQCRFRGHFVRDVFKLFNKYQSLIPSCVNDQDFYTFEPLKEIPKFQLICVTEPGGSVYGFDVSSIVQYELKLDAGVNLTNPYTRSEMDPSFFAELDRISAASKMGIVPTILDIDNTQEVNSLPFEKKVELRAISLFQHINSLGNYSDASWFMGLSRSRLIRLIRELYDIWNFRLHITRETKRNVCPPLGSPFDIGMNVSTSSTSDMELKDVVLSIFENFVYRGVDRDAQCLGSFYVLGALTLVSTIAAEASPWLYQSFVY